ncbi:hypothetical protein E4K10_49055 [Streptomyces sp. T1317-0309]|nr:hypothetical protein E4K10_49055 [Streptomyces sp. T1317-0309]
MGAPMCNNLVAAGYEVVAHDIDPGRAETALAMEHVGPPPRRRPPRPKYSSPWCRVLPKSRP